MKRLGIIALLIMLVSVGFWACASSGGGASGPAPSANPYTVDLSQLVMNGRHFGKQYDSLRVLFYDFPDSVDFSSFNRIRIRVSLFDGEYQPIDGADELAQVNLVYDKEGDWFGPGGGPGPNTPFKAFNLTGPSSQLASANGMPLPALSRKPDAIVFQNSSTDVSFIKVEEITFIGAASYSVDLSRLVMNGGSESLGFERQYDEFRLVFPEFPAAYDFSEYNYVRIRVALFDGDFEPVPADDELAQVNLVASRTPVETADWFGPAGGPGPNTPFKTFNLTGPSSQLHSMGGERMINKLPKTGPAGIVFQPSSDDVKFIRVDQITFF